MRASITEAAAQCHYQELARLALAGSTPFTYSFGGQDDPAAYWQRLESNGEPVLSILVELLERPFAFQDRRRNHAASMAFRLLL